MVKVKTFTNEIKIFHAMKQLAELDDQVNTFISDNGIQKVISISDTCTTDDKGETIGIIRVLTYSEN